MDLSNFETKDMKNMKMKKHIFDVSLSLMKQIGFDNLTIRMICSEAGISTGMFYKHFSSKENLLSFYYDLAQEDYETIIDEQFTKLPIKEQLIQFYTRVCGFTANLGVDFCRNFFCSKNKLMNTNLSQSRMIKITNKCLEQAIEGGFRPSPNRTPQQISQDLCVIVKGVIFDWSAHEGSYDMADYAQRLLYNCIDGLL